MISRLSGHVSTRHTMLWLHIRPLVLVAMCLSLLITARSAAAQGDSRFFPETGQTVSGSFLSYWQNNGGLPIFGYPIGDAHSEVDPITGNTYRVQWFERERFELHPEYAGTRDEVLLGLLGRQLTQGRENDPAFRPIASFPSTPSRAFYPLTGHSLANEFKTYWERNGGLPIYGYPISEPFEERNPSDGGRYTVQYFERARFETHPEKPVTFRILLGLLGNQLMPAGSPSIQITAGAAHITIRPNQTAVIPAGTSNMTVALQFARPIDQQNISVQLNQIAGTTAWRVVPSGQAPTRNSYTFGLQGGGDGSYTRVQVTQGTGNPATFFGIQIDANRTDAPPLVAGWTDPTTLLYSFYNAINRHDYQRAYSYWETPGAPNGVSADFDTFARGYNTTKSVAITTGTVMSGAGAGNIYFAVPIAITASQIDGSLRQYYGCYLLHQVNVEIENSTPPYPIAMRSARIFDAPANASTATMLSQASAFVQAGQCTQ